MTRPETAGPEDDTPTVPGLAPAPYDPDPLAVPGLHYMPRPDPPPATAGEHRRDRPRPWGWLSAAAALAALSALGVAWVIGAATDNPRRTPAATRTPDALAPALPSAPIDPTTGYLSPAAASPPATTATLSPTPPASTATSLSPTPSPSPRLVRVPGVVGERRAAAEATLRAAGFAVSVQLAPAPSARQTRRVLTQRPAGGQLARPGATVTLVVGTSARNGAAGAG